MDYAELHPWVYPGNQSGPLFQDNRAGSDIDWDSPNDYESVEAKAWLVEIPWGFGTRDYFVRARGRHWIAGHTVCVP